MGLGIVSRPGAPIEPNPWTRLRNAVSMISFSITLDIMRRIHLLIIIAMRSAIKHNMLNPVLFLLVAIAMRSAINHNVLNPVLFLLVVIAMRSAINQNVLNPVLCL